MAKTVLFVDDELSVLRAVEHAFASQEDVDVLTAATASQAAKALERHPVDLVVADLVMPNVSGAELIEQVQEHYPDVGVMLMADDHAAAASAATKLGESNEQLKDVAVLSKPWQTEELTKSVLSELERQLQKNEWGELIDIGGVTEAQLKRANRIREHMQRSAPLGEILVELGMMPEEKYAKVTEAQRSRMTILALLQKDGALSAEGLQAYNEAKAQSPNVKDRQLLVDSELITEEQYLLALSAKHRIPYVEPDIGDVDLRTLERSSLRYLTRNTALPVRVRNGKLRVIVNDPMNHQLIGELERIFGVPVEPACCSAEKIVEALRMLERVRRGKGGAQSTSLTYRSIEVIPQTEDESQEAVQIVDYLLLRAIQLGASDLHIEPLQHKIRVRVRVDGVLQQLTEFPTEMAPRLSSRVKILASADIAEKRLHQDGKIQVKVEGREVDIRVSTYVTIYGENLVLRLLDRNRNLMPIDKVGFAPRIMGVLNEVVLKTSSGLVLITGPTGSGKTSTLYSFVSYSLDPAKKVITCEDPVEYVVDGVIQCSVNEKTGPTFSDSLRAILRQDPDTIVVGEIRDGHTASLAFECALTGHKVYSTFHTEDSVTVVIRLLEMGMEPFLISSTLTAVIAQRLMRRLCPKCCVRGKPDKSELRFLAMERSDFQGEPVWVAKGCGHCDGTGYKGRLGVHEVLLPNDDFRDAVLHRAPAKELKRLARNLPEFMSLQEDAVTKCLQGQSTLSEVVGSTPRDVDMRPISTLRRIAGIGRDTDG